MMVDQVARFRGPEPIKREDIRELGEEVGDALRSGEKGSTETRGGRSSRGKADFKRGWVKNSLVGNIKDKRMMAEKSSSKDG